MNGELALLAVLSLLGAIFWGVLAGANHVRRWWVAAGVFAGLAVVLLVTAILVPSVALEAQALAQLP